MVFLGNGQRQIPPERLCFLFYPDICISMYIYLYQNQSIGRESTAPDTNCNIVKSLYH